MISSETEFVLVESTRSMSLQSDFTTDDKDKRWIGTCCFSRTEGINDAALDSWRRARSYRETPKSMEHYYTGGMSPHWCIFNDLGQNVDFSQRSFVSRADSARFFFSVPLRDFDGAVIGSLSMLDDKPRYGVSADDMLFCEDLGDTITQHLYHSMVSAQRQRSELLIKALGTFNNGGKSLRDWWVGQDDAKMQRGGVHRNGSNRNVHTPESAGMRFNDEFGAEDNASTSSQELSVNGEQTHLDDATHGKDPRSASDENAQASRERTTNHISGKDFQKAPAQDESNGNSVSPGMSRTPLKGHFAPEVNKGAATKKRDGALDAASLTKSAYDRASNLLRESTGAFGVVFFDASAASAIGAPDQRNSRKGRQSRSSSASSTMESLATSSDEARVLTNSDTDLSDIHDQWPKLSSIIARSTHKVAFDKTSGNSLSLQLNERDMTRLIKAYPCGKIFNYTTSGPPYSGSEDSGASEQASGDSSADVAQEPGVSSKHKRHARAISKAVGGARSIAFCPIWDATNDRYRSCILAWTHRSNRFFDNQEDMTYLHAFSHSLRAELNRIEAMVSDNAKAKFISSVSHELR